MSAPINEMQFSVVLQHSTDEFKYRSPSHPYSTQTRTVTRTHKGVHGGKWQSKGSLKQSVKVK